MREAHVARPEADGGNAGAVEQRGVRPRAHAQRRRVEATLAQLGGDRPRDRRVIGDVARRLREEHLDLGAETRPR